MQGWGGRRRLAQLWWWAAGVPGRSSIAPEEIWGILMQHGASEGACWVCHGGGRLPCSRPGQLPAERRPPVGNPK